MFFFPISSRLRREYFSTSNFRVALVVAALVGAAIVWGTRPRKESSLAELSGAGGQAQAGLYESYGSMLLPGESRFVMNRIFATTSKSELDYWLADEVIFTRFVQRFGVLKKTADRLRKQGKQDLVEYAFSVSVMGVLVETSNAPRVYGEKSVRGRGLEGYFGSQKWERDYASLDNIGEARRRQRRVNRVVVKASAPTPEGAQLLAREAMESLRSQLIWVSLRSAKSRRRAIENYIRINQRKIARASQSLMSHLQSSPERLSRIRANLDRLQSRASELELEMAGLRQQIASQETRAGVNWQSKQNPAQEKADELGRQLRSAERVLLATSPIVRSLRERFSGVERLAAEMEKEATVKSVSGLRVQLEAKSRMRSELGQEEQKLRDSLPSASEQRSYQEVNHELTTWETEQNSWEQQLLRARIEERLCQGDGTAILLQTPPRGRLATSDKQGFLSAYRKTLMFMPLAPLAGIISLVALVWLRSWRKIRRRVEYFMDAPVLAELPPPSSRYRRAWDDFKYTGTSGLAENPAQP